MQDFKFASITQNRIQIFDMDSTNDSNKENQPIATTLKGPIKIKKKTLQPQDSLPFQVPFQVPIPLLIPPPPTLPPLPPYPPSALLPVPVSHSSVGSSSSSSVAVITNRGTGAGGANTNRHGLSFEKKTNARSSLLSNGFIEVDGYYLSKSVEDRKFVFVSQGGFKKYMEQKHGIKEGKIYRNPDEAYIIEYNNGIKIMKILEKKAQNTQGSVEDKLWAGPIIKKSYKLMTDNKFEVHYGFCVNTFLKNKLISNQQKYIDLNKLLREDNISVLFGDDEDYFETLHEWVGVF